VTAFYVSTVEPYLKRAGTFEAFCQSVASLPMTEASVFIRPGNVQNLALSSPDGHRVRARIAAPRVVPDGVIVPLATGCK
jgi:hypothetical protein